MPPNPSSTAARLRLASSSLSRGSLVLFLLLSPAEGTLLTERVVERFDSVTTPTVQFVDGDWYDDDGDTGWDRQSIMAGSSSASSLNAYELDFTGTTVRADFDASEDDPWEYVSVRGDLDPPPFDLDGTREFQLLIKPSYSSTNGNRGFVSVILRLTMADGSLWDASKVLLDGMWQRGAVPVYGGDGGLQFGWVDWGLPGTFDLSAAVGWEIIFVDLPPGRHVVELYGLHAKGAFSDATAAEPFDTRFLSYGGPLDTAESNVLFLRDDGGTNPQSDGSTDWLGHRIKYSVHYSRSSFLEARYRSDGAEGETVSIRKEAGASSYFDLTGATSVVAYVGADNKAGSLVLSLTMEDGSVWRKGSDANLAKDQGYVLGGMETNRPYRFPLDGFARAEGSPDGEFLPDRVKSWELFFGNLNSGVHRVTVQEVRARSLMPLGASEDGFQEKGETVRWVSGELRNDGLHATVSSTGENTHDGILIVGDELSSVSDGFLIELTTPVPLNYVAFELVDPSGSSTPRRATFALSGAGRALVRIHTACPPLPPGVMARPGNQMEYRCRSLQGDFYGADLSAPYRWELHLSGVPAGEHDLVIGVFPQVE